MRKFYCHRKLLSRKKHSGKYSWLFLPLAGFAGLIWFLIRVLPKPSRASYPCMKVAIPFASGFITWLLGVLTSGIAWEKMKRTKRKAKFHWAFVFALLAFLGILWTTTTGEKSAQAHFANAIHEPNKPMGEPKGIFPGRVVWIHNPDATNERCTNQKGDGWFLPKNNNQAVIDQMLSDGLRALTGKSTDQEAWDAIFRYHNVQRGKGNVGYTPGETIFIKINATSSWGGNFNSNDLSVVENQWYGIAETSPYLILALLRQLVNVVGVAQTDIYVGDPLKHIYKHCFDLWHAEFPHVHYMDHDYGPEKNREKIAYTPQPTIFYSDRGTVMMTGTWNDPHAGVPTENDRLCTLFESCEYLINVPTLKGHKRAGITMFAKNHFGSHARENAVHLHGGLVNPTENDPFRAGYGLYRVQVDLMGHQWLGLKNLVCLMDALYAGPEAVYKPTKWKLAPFHNDWVSSIFLSQDPVAIESVGYDFLRAEYTSDTPYSWVQMEGVDDYLHQAADSTQWPRGIQYDPENDGTPIGSLGVHEHWNNPIEKKYSRNLGTGNGIELVIVEGTFNSVKERSLPMPSAFHLYQGYPNPFNASTRIRYVLAEPGKVHLQIVNLLGQPICDLVDQELSPGSYEAVWNGATNQGPEASSGVYFCVMRAQGHSGNYHSSTRIVLVK